MRRPRLRLLPFVAFPMACGGGTSSSGTPSGPADALGTIEVNASTTGIDTDLDGYVVVLTLGNVRKEERIPTSGSTPVEFRVKPGTHRVELEDRAGNCRLVGDAPASVEVESGRTSNVRFEVACEDIVPIYGRIVRAAASWASASSASNVGLWITDPDGTDLMRLTTPPSPAWDNQPHVSADGKRIVYVRHAPELGASIRIVNADGTDEPGYLIEGQNPRWSPDGEWIVFFMPVDGGLPDLHIMRPDGEGLVNLTRAPEHPDIHPDWSPDGSRIALRSVRRDGTFGDLYTIEPSGAGLVQLTEAPSGGDFNPIWSPDGNRIVFNSNRTGHYRVYVMNPDGSGIQQLTPHLATWHDFAMAWSPEGDRILFKREPTQRTGQADPELFILDLGSGAIDQITDNDMDDHAAWWSR